MFAPIYSLRLSHCLPLSVCPSVCFSHYLSSSTDLRSVCLSLTLCIIGRYVYQVVFRSTSGSVCLSISLCLSVCLSVCVLLIRLSVYQFVHQSVYINRSFDLSISARLSVCLSFCDCLSVSLDHCAVWSISLSLYIRTLCLWVCLSVCLPVYQPICHCVSQSVDLSVWRSIDVDMTIVRCSFCCDDSVSSPVTKETIRGRRRRRGGRCLSHPSQEQLR